jgi:hypothetical protein
MSQDAIRVIHDLQPCHDREGNAWLGWLRDLSDWDKHRALQVGVVAGVFGGFMAGPLPAAPTGQAYEVIYVRPPGPFDDRTVLGTIEIPANVNLEPDAKIDLVFAEGTGAADRPVTDVLQEIARRISADVYPALYPHV